MERSEEKARTVAIIDADFIPYYVCHNKKDEPIKTLADCKRLADEFIQHICLATKADMYATFLTVGKCFRYDVNPSYKSNRKYTDQPKYLSEIKEHILINHNGYYDKRYEADDLVLSFRKSNPQYKCIIVSPDKDILNLEGMHYNPKKGEFKFTLPEEEVEYFWRSMITGDTVDGIKGVPGKGTAYFDKISQNYCYDIVLADYYRTEVLGAYVTYFGEYVGIEEFYKNYKSLKIIDDAVLQDVKLNKVKSDETTELTGAEIE
jgi:hypothetical protein